MSDAMNVERVAIVDLILDPGNVRRHGEHNIEAIKASLLKFGQQKPIVIGSDNVVIAGNGTVVGAKELGWEHLFVTRSALKGNDRKTYAIADNRTSELAEWDEPDLAEMLKSLPTLVGSGFDGVELKKLLKKLDDSPAPDDSKKLKSQWQIVVECRDELHQLDLLGRFDAEGLTCRALIS